MEDVLALSNYVHFIKFSVSDTLVLPLLELAGQSYWIQLIPW